MLFRSYKIFVFYIKKILSGFFVLILLEIVRVLLMVLEIF